MATIELKFIAKEYLAVNNFYENLEDKIPYKQILSSSYCEEGDDIIIRCKFRCDGHEFSWLYTNIVKPLSNVTYFSYEDKGKY